MKLVIALNNETVYADVGTRYDDRTDHDRGVVFKFRVEAYAGKGIAVVLEFFDLLPAKGIKPVSG